MGRGGGDPRRGGGRDPGDPGCPGCSSAWPRRWASAFFFAQFFYTKTLACSGWTTWKTHRPSAFESDTRYYYLLLAFAIVGIALILTIQRSRLGRLLRSPRRFPDRTGDARCLGEHHPGPGVLHLGVHRRDRWGALRRGVRFGRWDRVQLRGITGPARGARRLGPFDDHRRDRRPGAGPRSCPRTTSGVDDGFQIAFGAGAILAAVFATTKVHLPLHDWAQAGRWRRESTTAARISARTVPIVAKREPVSTSKQNR